MAIAIWVVPGSSRSVVDGRHGDRVKVRVRSPAEDGRANSEVARLLADLLGDDVELISGIRGRSKVFVVPQADVESVRRKLGL